MNTVGDGSSDAGIVTDFLRKNLANYSWESGEMSDYVAFLRKRADECAPGLRKFFLDQAAKCEADPKHEGITRAILSIGKQASKLMREGKI